MGDGEDTDLTSAARAVCDIVRTTLGPFGSNKLVIREGGTVTTTASGSAVLEQLDLTDPTVTLLRTAADDFRTRHGDGASGLVAVTGALLREAERLVDVGVHPTAIERGYRDALRVAIDHVDERTRPISVVGADAVARTALTATRNPHVRRDVGKYVAQVAETVFADSEADDEFAPRRVKVVARTGGSHAQTKVVRGVVLDKEPINESMPLSADGAGIALLSSTVDRPSLGTETARRDLDLSLTSASFEDRAAIGEREREAFEDRLRAAIEAGCRVLITTRAVNDRVKTTLANHGVLALQRVDEADIERLARATGARVVPDLDHVTAEMLGTADVNVRRKAGRDVTVVESDANEAVYTLFCRAPDPRSVDSFRRSVESALAAVAAAERSDTVVPGGGAIEASASRVVREYARSVDGREQLAVEAFGDALLTVPRALAVSTGMDGWQGVVRLRVAHDEGRTTTGIDALAGTTADVLDDDPIVEPATLKRAAWSAATDVATKLVRIDDRLPASDLGSDDAPDAGRGISGD